MNVSEIQVEILRVAGLSIINYCYVLYNASTKTALLVDPAWDFYAINQILVSKKLQLVGILITHHHFDHLNLSTSFARYYNVPIYISRVEAEFYNIRDPNLVTFEGSTELDFPGHKITTILCPGHTKGSVCYLTEQHLFAGDVLFIEGCGICEGKGANVEDMFYSLQRLLTMLTSKTLIYPGHRYKYEIPQNLEFVLENNIYLQIKDISKFIQLRMLKNTKNFAFI